MRQILRRLARDRRGTAAVEMALISPFVVMLFFGTLELTQLIRVQSKLTRATQAIQDIVAGQTTASTSSLLIAFTGGQIVMTPFVSSNMTAAIASVTFNSSAAAVAVSWQQLENGSSGMTVAVACAAAASMSLGSDSVIVVQATYVYKPIFYYLLGKTFTLTQTAYGRPRNTSVVSGPSSSNGATGNC